MFYFIYKTTNLINQKIYIGQHGQERSEYDGYLGSGTILINAIKKYGREKFIRETIECCTSANKDEREIYWIAELSATNPLIGYNISVGGNSPMNRRNHTDETKRKIGQANKYNGRPHTEEEKQNISKANKNKRLGDCNSNAKYNYYLSNNEYYWKYFTDKDRRNIKSQFFKKRLNVINYKGITIERKLKQL